MMIMMMMMMMNDDDNRNKNNKYKELTTIRSSSNDRNDAEIHGSKITACTRNAQLGTAGAGGKPSSPLSCRIVVGTVASRRTLALDCSMSAVSKAMSPTLLSRCVSEQQVEEASEGLRAP